MSKLIVFEGIDGTGKGTQIARAIEYLQGLGREVIQTKDPGGTKLGACIRRVMYEEVTTHEMMPGVVPEPERRLLSEQATYMTQRYVPPPIAEAYMNGHGRPADAMIFLFGDPFKMVERARARETETHQTAKAWNDPYILKKIQDEYVKQFSHLPEFFPVNVDGKSPDQVWESVRHILKTQVVDNA